MSKRLTSPMHRVLQNLYDGKEAGEGFSQLNHQGGLPAILSSLKKRGLAMEQRNGKLKLTAAGTIALDEENKRRRSMQ